MGKFNGIKLTSKGLRLQAKVQTGEKLIFKGIVVGTGYLPDNADIVTMTELINPVMDAQTDIIGNKVTGDGYSQLEARITSGATAFYLREIGIIATDPDEGDILYAYTNAGDYADFIPAAVDNITTQDITLVTAIGNTEDIEVNITLDAEVSREEFEAYKGVVTAQTSQMTHDITSKLSAVFVPELPTSFANYPFDTDMAFTTIERCTAAITTDGTSKYLTVTSAANAGNLYGLANLNFADISENATSMIIEMDTHIPASSRWWIGFADLTKRPGTSNKTTYDTSGNAFYFGTKDGSYYYVNDTAKTAVDFAGKWLHIKAVIDIANKQVSYKITDRTANTLVLSDTVDFADTETDRITGIELYTWTQTSIDVDNVAITTNKNISENKVYIAGTNGKYDVYMYEGKEPRLIASHTSVASVDEAGMIKLYSGTYNGEKVNRSGIVVYDDGTAVIYTDPNYGTDRSGDGKVITAPAEPEEIFAGTNDYKPLVPATFNQFINYSTTPQRIGTWIDGTPVFRQVIPLTEITETGFILVRSYLSCSDCAILKSNIFVQNNLNDYSIESTAHSETYSIENEGRIINIKSLDDSKYSDLPEAWYGIVEFAAEESDITTI